MTKVCLCTYILFATISCHDGNNHSHCHFYFIIYSQQVCFNVTKCSEERTGNVAVRCSRETLDRFCVLWKGWAQFNSETISTYCYREELLQPLALWTLTGFWKGVDQEKNKLLLCSKEREELFNYTSRDWEERFEPGGNGAASRKENKPQVHAGKGLLQTPQPRRQATEGLG